MFVPIIVRSVHEKRHFWSLGCQNRAGRPIQRGALTERAHDLGVSLDIFRPPLQHLALRFLHLSLRVFQNLASEPPCASWALPRSIPPGGFHGNQPGSLFRGVFCWEEAGSGSEVRKREGRFVRGAKFSKIRCKTPQNYSEIEN